MGDEVWGDEGDLLSGQVARTWGALGCSLLSHRLPSEQGNAPQITLVVSVRDSTDRALHIELVRCNIYHCWDPLLG